MSKPSTSMKVLYSELNEQVLSAGAEQLQKAGFTVQTAIGRKAVQEALNQTAFDLVVLGTTLSRDDRHHLPYMAKKAKEDCAVLVLHNSGHHYAVDMAIDSRDGDHKVLEAAAEVLATSSSSS